MKAIRIHQYGDASTLTLEEIPHLSIADDQLLVRIRDAGVNPIDWKIRHGYMKQVMPAAFPLTLGQDFAGEVVDRGKNVTQFAAGDRVFGFAQGNLCRVRSCSGIDCCRHSELSRFRDSSGAADGRIDGTADYS